MPLFPPASPASAPSADFLPIGIYTCDGAGRVTYANVRALELWGATVPELSALKLGGWRAVYRLDGTPADIGFPFGALDAGQPQALRAQRYSVERHDGRMLSILLDAEPAREGGGFTIVFQEVPSHSRSEAERRLAAIVESSDDAIISKDLNGNILTWNAGAQNLFGYRAEEVVGKSIRLLIPPDRLGEEEEILSRIRRGEKTAHYETIRLRKDGAEVHISLTVSPLKDEDGRTVGASKIGRNITAQKRAQDELWQREQIYRSIGESINYGIWVCDAEGRNIYASESFLRLVGLTQEECSNLDWMQCLHPDDAAAVAHDWAECVRKGEFWEREHRFRGVDGKYHPVLARGVPVRDQNGRIMRWVGINLDIAVYKATEEKLSRRTKTLEAFNAVGSILVAERNLSNIVQGVTDGARAICGAEFGAFFYNVINDIGEAYTLYTLSGAPREAFAQFPMPRNTALFGPTFRGEGVIRIGDVAKDPRFGKNAPFNGMPKGHLPVRSYLAVPVTSATGEVLGGLFFGHSQPDQFTEEAEVTIVSLAAQAAIAVENARLQQTAQRELEQQRAAQAEVRQREQQLRLVTDHAPVFLVQVDRQFRYKFVNQTYADRFGAKAEDLIGKRLAEVVGDEAFASFEHHVREVFEGRRVAFEMEVPYKAIGKRWVDVVYVPERDAKGDVVGLVAVITDSTARKQAEKELERARDDALAASKAKDDFLAALSHELRTPLNPVLLLASDGAINPSIPPEVREDFDNIRKNIELEARLIDDLLDLTRITHGKVVLDKRLIDVHAVLKDAINNTRPDLEQKRLELHVRLEAFPSQVMGDPVRLQQVFWNVLKNAVKFTHAGSIAVTSTLAKGGTRLSISVIDTGLGMTDSELKRAFDAFAQGDHAHAGPSHRFGGLGLGLAISRSLVELHGGEIRASSAGRGHGSAFTIELPLASIPSEATDPSPGARGAGPEGSARDVSAPRIQRLLVVDDHAPTRITLKNLLVRRGYDVVLAENMHEGVTRGASEPFDLIISDIGLPDGDGCELMRQLQAVRPDLRGIALSGYGMEEDVARTRAAGFTLHLTKPINMENLQDSIRALLTRPN